MRASLCPANPCSSRLRRPTHSPVAGGACTPPGAEHGLVRERAGSRGATRACRSAARAGGGPANLHAGAMASPEAAVGARQTTACPPICCRPPPRRRRRPPHSRAPSHSARPNRQKQMASSCTRARLRPRARRSGLGCCTRWACSTLGRRTASTPSPSCCARCSTCPSQSCRSWTRVGFGAARGSGGGRNAPHTPAPLTKPACGAGHPGDNALVAWQQQREQEQEGEEEEEQNIARIAWRAPCRRHPAHRAPSPPPPRRAPVVQVCAGAGRLL